MITNKSLKQYLMDGLTCPNCGDREMTVVGEDDFDSTNAFRSIKCLECGVRYNENYTLTGIEVDIDNTDTEGVGYACLNAKVSF